MTPDYYALLGVAREAEGEIIRAAYRVLARRYHPDAATTASPHEQGGKQGGPAGLAGHAREIRRGAGHGTAGAGLDLRQTLTRSTRSVISDGSGLQTMARTNHLDQILALSKMTFAFTGPMP